MVRHRHLAADATRVAEVRDGGVGGIVARESGRDPVLPALPEVAVQLFDQLLALVSKHRRQGDDVVDVAAEALRRSRWLHGLSSPNRRDARTSRGDGRRRATSARPLGVSV